MNYKFSPETNFKQTEIGQIPEDWDVVSFSEIAEFNLGRTPRRDNIEYWNEGYFPWVSISDMKDFGRIKLTKELISKKALKEVFNNKFSRKGTLLMSFKLTIGRTSILEIDAVHNEAIISINPNEEIADKNYLFYYLPTINFQEYFDKVVKGNTLNKSKIENLKIPLPPLPVQRKIAEILKAIDDKIEKEEAKKKALENLFKSLLHNLMTGKIRIKLNGG